MQRQGPRGTFEAADTFLAAGVKRAQQRAPMAQGSSERVPAPLKFKAFSKGTDFLGGFLLKHGIFSTNDFGRRKDK